MTPYELRFLLHLRTTPDPWPYDDTELYRQVVNGFKAEGVIESNVTGWKLTKLGEAWVKVLLNVPKPKLCFIDYAGHIVDV